jgi:hypothetical protein
MLVVMRVQPERSFVQREAEQKQRTEQHSTVEGDTTDGDDQHWRIKMLLGDENIHNFLT